MLEQWVEVLALTIIILTHTTTRTSDPVLEVELQEVLVLVAAVLPPQQPLTSSVVAVALERLHRLLLHRWIHCAKLAIASSRV